MPEKGWEIITVRTKTKKTLMRVSRDKGMSVNDFVMSLIKGDGLKRRIRDNR